jgi:GT2 family glycosyltransferase
MGFSQHLRVTHMHTPRLAVITINHQHGEMITKMIDSLTALAQSDQPAQIFVINNVEDEAVKTWLTTEHPEITLIENAHPKGFASNINATIRQHPAFDFYLLINPDVICLPEMIPALVRKMSEDSEVGVAGPKLLNMDGSVQPSRRRFATFPVLILRALHVDALFKNLSAVDRYLMNDVRFDSDVEVDWITGAVMLLRKQALDEVGLFDEQFYMYFEDEDLCCRMWQQGWKVCYLPDAQAYHAHLAEGRKRILSQANIRHITSAFKMLIKYRGKITQCGGKNFGSHDTLSDGS